MKGLNQKGRINKAEKIKEIYKEFHLKISELRKKQNIIIENYRQKIEKKQIDKIHKELGLK